MRNGRTKRALVAGGAGFIGSHICDTLVGNGYEVVCLDNLQTGRLENLRSVERDPRFDMVQGDVTDDLPRSVRKTRFTHVLNLACAASPPHYQADPEHTMMTNVVGTRNLLRLAEAQGARFLLCSTSEVYGDPEVHPQNEAYRGWVNCTGPRACYDEGKRAAETLCWDFERMGRAEVRVARLFNTYGPRMRPDDGRVVSNVICQALAGDEVTIYGDGSQTRSFCFIEDLIDGLLRFLDHPCPRLGPVNLGNPVELTILELVDVVLSLIGSQSQIVTCPLPVDDPRRRRPDISRAIELLGWQPRISLQQGLEATVAYFIGEMERDGRHSPSPVPIAQHWRRPAPSVVAAE